MSDLPSYDFDSKDEKDVSVKLKKDNATDIMNYINSIS